ncbi:MAG: polymer-forming cytoskeletal protein [bacterium]
MAEEVSKPLGSGGAGEITTLLGRGSEFSGKLTFEGTVRIDGKFSGEIFSEGTLVVGNGAELSADISVRSVLIQGAVQGNVTAKEVIEIHAPARVQGKLICPQLQIEKGVLFDGTCQMSDKKPEKAISGGKGGGSGTDG